MGFVVNRVVLDLVSVCGYFMVQVLIVGSMLKQVVSAGGTVPRLWYKGRDLRVFYK